MSGVADRIDTVIEAAMFKGWSLDGPALSRDEVNDLLDNLGSKVRVEIEADLATFWFARSFIAGYEAARREQDAPADPCALAGLLAQMWMDAHYNDMHSAAEFEGLCRLILQKRTQRSPE